MRARAYDWEPFGLMKLKGSRKLSSFRGGDKYFKRSLRLVAEAITDVVVLSNLVKRIVASTKN